MNKTDRELLEYLQSYLTERRQKRFDEVLMKRTRHFTVAVEDVYQLHNTSAVLRSCDIFGIQDLHIIEEKYQDRIDGEIAMGAQKWISITKHQSAVDCVRHIKLSGYQVVATTPHHDECQLEDFDFTRPSCFVFGRETDGLSREVMDQADCFLTIPMYGFTESLNISVSAAIILQSVTQKLRSSGLSWQLSVEEREELKLDWCKKSIKSIDQILERYYQSQ